MHQEDLFAHLVDECLGFHKELAIILNDNPTIADDDIDAMSVLAVLTQGVYFTRWLAMEKKCKI